MLYNNYSVLSICAPVILNNKFPFWDQEKEKEHQDASPLYNISLNLAMCIVIRTLLS